MTKEDWVDRRLLELRGILLTGFVTKETDGNRLWRDIKNCNERLDLWLRKTFDEFNQTGKT